MATTTATAITTNTTTTTTSSNSANTNTTMLLAQHCKYDICFYSRESPVGSRREGRGLWLKQYENKPTEAPDEGKEEEILTVGRTVLPWCERWHC